MESENAHGCAQNAEDGFSLERYHKDGDGFLSHIERVVGDETWVSFVNVETKNSQSSAPNKPKTFKQRCLPES
jgi:hypothetical protein